MRSRALMVVAACVACGQGRPQQRVTPRVTGALPGPTQHLLRLPGRVDDLAEAVAPLPKVNDFTSVVTALSRVTDVVEAYDEKAAQRARRLVAKLKHSRANARGQADALRDAVGVALNALGDQLVESHTDDERRAYVHARRANTRIASGVALDDQPREVGALMRALANLTAVITDAKPPFSPDTDTTLGYDPTQFLARSQGASAAVTDLARQRKWMTAAVRASRALDLLANALEVAPLTLANHDWHGLVSTIRYGALELQREAAVNVERSSRIRVGLHAASDGLDDLATVERTPAIRLLATNARKAVQRLDDDVVFVFQRGLIQEAFRATADALVVAAHEMPRRLT